MRYIDEFCDPGLAKRLIDTINKIVEVVDKEIVLMEVCGTHTVAIFKHGLRELFPASLKLLSGPGCPVCVTSTQDMDAAIWLSRQKNVVLTTFGDMMRVPGTMDARGATSSLEKQRAEGADIRVVYSVLDAIELAKTNPAKKVVFLGIGFETTAPSIASGLQLASKQGLDNFFVYSAHKLIPPAMKALLEAGEVKIDGFICPGHVSTIIGAKPYAFIAEQYHIPCVITGFEPLDILQAILMLVKARERGRVGVEIQYTRAVKPEGNVVAQRILAEVFEPIDAAWRGIGVIPDSGLRIRQEYSRFDVLLQFSIPQFGHGEEDTGCICGLILRGIAIPTDCPLFKTVCSPENPVGACMVSSEGTCAAYYMYGG
ncbi:MAG: hydrogenase formation protein HypD [Candidatus Desantisbacteria bacterium]